MKKDFDFKRQNKTGFLKKARIHPKFLYWKTELHIFSFFILLIFFMSLIFSVFIYKNDLFTSIKNKNIFSNFQNINTELSFASLDSLITKTIVNIDFMQNIVDKKLPAKEFSQIQIYKIKLQNIGEDLKVFQDTLPQLQKSIVSLHSKADFSYALEYIQQYEPILSRLHKEIYEILIMAEKFPRITKKYQNIVNNMSEYHTYIEHFPRFIEILKVILGDKKPHNIIVWFQNSHEKRSTGGFIGSFLELNIFNGHIQKSKVQDIYAYDRHITTHPKAPNLAQILLGKNQWSLRDANYSPSFKVSAQSFIQFYKKAGGPEPDTIIAINQNILEDILSLTSEVSVNTSSFIEEKQTSQKKDNIITLNNENASFVLSYITEGKFTKTNNPKFFLSEVLFPLILKKVSQELSLADIFTLYKKNKHQISLYSQNKIISELGSLLSLGNNFTQIINNKYSIYLNELSISGNKSGAFIKQNISLQIKDQYNEIRIHRSHLWDKKEEKLFTKLQKTLPDPKIPIKELKRILGKGSYNGIYQFFLPLESKNITLSPSTLLFKTWKENNKLLLEIQSPLLYPQNSDEIFIQFTHPTSKKIFLQEPLI
jgi:hypothetical protein